MSAQSSRLPPSRSGSASYIYLRNSRNLFVRINVKGAFKEATKSGACSFVLQHFVGVLAALKSLKSLIVPLNTAFQNQDLFNLSSIHSTLKPPLDDATRSLSLSHGALAPPGAVSAPFSAPRSTRTVTSLRGSWKQAEENGRTHRALPRRAAR